MRIPFRNLRHKATPEQIEQTHVVVEEAVSPARAFGYYASAEALRDEIIAVLDLSAAPQSQIDGAYDALDLLFGRAQKYHRLSNALDEMREFLAEVD